MVMQAALTGGQRQLLGNRDPVIASRLIDFRQANHTKAADDGD
jgi:hypothetical protein